jgi:hypothetical protein
MTTPVVISTIRVERSVEVGVNVRQKERHMNFNLPNYSRLPGFQLPDFNRRESNLIEEEEKRVAESANAQAIGKLQKTVWWMGVMTITLLLEIMALQFYYLKDMTDRFNQTDQQLNTILQEMKGTPTPQEHESYEWYSPDICQPHEYKEPAETSDYASI